jgi:hypothetical protein
MSSQSRKALAPSAEFPGSIYDAPMQRGKRETTVENVELGLSWREAIGIVLFVAAAVAAVRLIGF